MNKKQMSKIICSNILRKFDYMKCQETLLVSTIMDSLKEIEDRNFTNQDDISIKTCDD